MVTKIYTLTDEALENLIENWNEDEEYSQRWIAILEDSISELKRYNTDRTPLSEKRKAHINNSNFTIIRRNMSPYTTKSKTYINQYISKPESIPVSKDKFKRLQEINRNAMIWSNKFNALVKKYKIEQSLYNQSFISEDGILDFVGFFKN